MRTNDVSLNAKTNEKQPAFGRRSPWRLPSWLHGWMLPVIVIVLWESASALELLSDSVLPAPSRIALTFWHLCTNGDMTEHLAASIIRAGGGFLLGAATGLLLGVFTGLGKWLNKHLIQQSKCCGRFRCLRSFRCSFCGSESENYPKYC